MNQCVMLKLSFGNADTESSSMTAGSQHQKQWKWLEGGNLALTLFWLQWWGAGLLQSYYPLWGETISALEPSCRQIA